MKIKALLIATLITTPAIAEVAFVHNPDGTVTRIETTTSMNPNAEIDAASRPLTPAEQAKLQAAETAPVSETEQAHIRAINKARAEGANPELETSAGQFNGINYQDRGLTGYQDPYAANSRAYISNENGAAAPAPSSNVFIKGGDGTRHEDRSDAVVTGTKSFLYR